MSIGAISAWRWSPWQFAGSYGQLFAFFWTYMLLQILAGYLGDRFRFNWTYVAAFLLWSLGSASIGPTASL
jgi:MFS family permease